MPVALTEDDDLSLASANQHATACRLEHAIDDDLEVALTIYLNDPKIDPSGTPIPTMSEDIELRVNSASKGMRDITQLAAGESAEIKIIVAGPNEMTRLNDMGLCVGNNIKSLGPQTYQVDDVLIQLDEEIAKRILT